jgi:2-keto-4-pentenoate hydratase
VDPVLRSALELQLRRRPAGSRVGWKLGMGQRERIGPGPVIGHLTSSTELASGTVFDAGGVADLHADAEVAVLLGDDGGIAGYGAALELVDLGSPPDNPHDVVAANVFHRAVVFGSLDRPAPSPEAEGRLIVNGEARAAAPMDRDFGELVDTVAELLAELGDHLQPGDRLITGSVVQVPVAPGDEVIADLGPLGRVGVRVAWVPAADSSP